MDTNIDFKTLWTKQSASVPDISVVIGEVKRLQKKYLKRLITANVLLLLTSAFVIFVWIYFQPEYVTTKLGIILVVLAMVSFLFVLNRLYPIIQKEIPTESNHDYLGHLLQIQKRQRFMHTTMMNVYFLLLSIGLCLYLYEYTQRMTLTGGVITYGITISWILVNWFYVRPRQIKKQQRELGEMISKVEAMKAQLSA